MTTIPIAWVIAILVILLATTVLSRRQLPLAARVFFAVGLLSIAVVTGFVGLRLEYGWAGLSRLQPHFSIIAAPALWLGFRALMEQDMAEARLRRGNGAGSRAGGRAGAGGAIAAAVLVDGCGCAGCECPLCRSSGQAAAVSAGTIRACGATKPAVCQGRAGGRHGVCAADRRRRCLHSRGHALCGGRGDDGLSHRRVRGSGDLCDHWRVYRHPPRASARRRRR